MQEVHIQIDNKYDNQQTHEYNLNTQLFKLNMHSNESEQNRNETHALL